jgi:hypothetical protein
VKLVRLHASGRNFPDKDKEPHFIVSCEKHHDEAEARVGVLFLNTVSHWEAPAESGDVCQYASRGDCGDLK